MVEVAVVGAAGYAGIEAVRLVLGHPRLRPDACHLGCRRRQAGRRSSIPRSRASPTLSFTAPDVDAIAGCGDCRAPGGAAHRRARPRARAARARGHGHRHVGRLPAQGPARLRGVVRRDAHVARAARPRRSSGCPSSTGRGFPARGSSRVPAAIRRRRRWRRFRRSSRAWRSAPGSWSTRSRASRVRALGECRHALRHRQRGGPAVQGRRASPHPRDRAGAVAARPAASSRSIFTPHLVPMTRGLLSTVYLDVEDDFTTEEAVELYRGRYDEEPFVHVHDAGYMPSTAEVRGHQPRVDRRRRRRADEHARRRVRDRQPRQGRRRSGRAVPQRRSWVSRDGRVRPTRAGRLAARSTRAVTLPARRTIRPRQPELP